MSPTSLSPTAVQHAKSYHMTHMHDTYPKLGIVLFPEKVTCIFAFDETIDTPLYTAWGSWFECSVTCVTDQEPFGTQVLK